jgi:hypothetical protein
MHLSHRLVTPPHPQADEQRSLIAPHMRSQDGRSRAGETFVDIFGDEDASTMSFVTNRPQVSA